MKKALVVIDVQNFFTVGKAKNLPEKIAAHIKHSKYDHVLFTRMKFDPSSNFWKILKWKGPIKSPEIDIHTLLVPFARPETTFDKTTYSVFKSTEFLEFLYKNEIKILNLCGINIDACVLASAFEAFDLGFDVSVLEELTSVSSTKQEYENAAKVILARNLKDKS